MPSEVEIAELVTLNKKGNDIASMWEIQQTADQLRFLIQFVKSGSLWYLVLPVPTHRKPVLLEPFGGAASSVYGYAVLRTLFWERLSGF